MLFRTPVTLGLVLDLSPARRRHVDGVRRALCAVVARFAPEDVLLAYRGDALVRTDGPGGHVCTVATYEPGPVRPSLPRRLDEVARRVGDEPPDRPRRLVLVTDRFTAQDGSQVAPVVRWCGAGLSDIRLLCVAAGCPCPLADVWGVFGAGNVVEAAGEGVGGGVGNWLEGLP